jgi:hypothetical protein
VISEEIDSGQPRIKMYEDDKGQFKGDALVVYFRPESVNLAVQMLDDSDFRLGTHGPVGKMRVQAADFSYKSQQEAPVKKNKGDQKKIIKKTQKMNRYDLCSCADHNTYSSTVSLRTGMTMTRRPWNRQAQSGTGWLYSNICSLYRSLRYAGSLVHLAGVDNGIGGPECNTRDQRGHS